MPDVKLGTLELVLAKDSKGVRAFQFLHAPDEPGEPGRIGTIVFDQLHHGLGAELSLTADRYQANLSASPPSAWVPGSLFSAGTLADTASGDIDHTQAEIEILTTAPPSVAVGSFQWKGDVYFTLPRRVIKVAAGDGLITTVFTPSMTTLLSGQPAFYNGNWWVGLVDSSVDPGESAGHVFFDTDLDTWTEFSGVGDAEVSFFFALHAGIFALEVNGLGATRAWDLKFTDAGAPHLGTAWVDIVTNRPTPQATGIHSLGRFILVFGDAGEIVAVADAPPVKSLVSRGVFADDDPLFGHTSRPWGADLFLPSRRGMSAVNIDRLAARDVTPPNIQGVLGDRQFLPRALIPMGPDMLVGTRNEPQAGANHSGSILIVRRYPEGVFYNLVRDTFVSAALGNADVYAMEYIPNSGKLTILFGNTTGSRVKVLYLPNEKLGKPSTFLPSSQLVTSDTYGPFPGRKLALQVRGFYPAATTNSVAVGVIPDRGVAVAAGTVSAVGPFVLTGARIVGSTFALELDLPAGVGAEWPRLLLPIMLDYVEEPRAGDRIRIAVEAPVGSRRVDSGGDSVEKVLKDIRDLRNSSSTVTLELLDVAGAPSTFTVLVEAVSSVEERPMLKREFPSAVAFVDLRVV